jgi:hypothetical protein
MANKQRPSENNVDPPTRSMPQWFSTSAYYVRIGLGLFLALTALNFMFSGCSARAQMSNFWRPATQVLSSDQIKAIVADNSNVPISEVDQSWLNSMRVHQTGELILVDFHNPQLCGQAGCAYVGYLFDEELQRLTRVLTTRLRPELPPGVSLFTIETEQATQPPCLKINQVSDRQLLESTLCFNGTEYIRQSAIEKPIPGE